MINVIVELSKYLILTLMIIYTFHCFYTVRQQDEIERNELLRQQMVLIFFMDFTAFLVIYLKTFNFQVIVFYVEMMVFFAAVQILYRIFYKKASLLLLNNMCMLLSVGFIMLCRLDIATATKQLVIAAAASGIALIIPVMIRKMKFFRRLTWLYAGVGIILLAAVFLLARTSYGAKLSLMGIQPSEVIKITFVFYSLSVFQSKRFSHGCAGNCSGGSSCGHPGAFQRSWKRGDLFCRLSCNALCFHKKASVSGTWTGGGKPWGSGGILPFRSCAPESQRMERSDGCLSERGLSDRPVTVCHRNRRLVRHGTLPGFAGVYSGCKK